MSDSFTAEELKEQEDLHRPEFTMTLRPSVVALARVASGDNPTRSVEIGQMKLYIAGLMTLCESPPTVNIEERERCMSRAIVHLEDALLLIEKALKAR